MVTSLHVPDIVSMTRGRGSAQWTHDSGRTHVLFIVHLPRGGGGRSDGDGRLGSFVGFQGGKWLSAHVDDLRAPREASLSLDEALHTSISDLFYSEGNAFSNEVTMKQGEEGEEEEKVEIQQKANTRGTYQCSCMLSCRTRNQ